MSGLKENLLIEMLAINSLPTRTMSYSPTDDLEDALYYLDTAFDTVATLLHTASDQEKNQAFEEIDKQLKLIEQYRPHMPF